MPDAITFPELDDAAIQRALAILVDVGTAIALECKTPPGTHHETPLAARAIAYDRVALAVRRTILLLEHLRANPIPNPVSREARRVDARKQVLRTVEDTIERKATPAKAADLRVELLERLDSLDFADDLARLSPAEIIQNLCRDLGLANLPGARTYARRTPDDIAILCAQAAAAPRAGLPAWSPTPPERPAPS